MKRTLYHPWWTHLPAVSLLALLLWTIYSTWPLPPEIPLQFDWSGQAVRWGSRWEALTILLAIPLLTLGGSFLIDEQWARQESRRRFNPFALLDELTLGLIAGIAIGYLRGTARGQTTLDVSWIFVSILTGGAVAIAAILESLRPYRPRPESLHEPQPLPDLLQRIRSGQRWSYWESQNPFYLRLLIPLTSIILLATTLLVARQNPWLLLLVIPSLLLMIACWGGLRVVVNDRNLIVRLGIMGVRLLKIDLPQLAEATVQSFSPLADFGGWGIRVNRQMWAFYFRGDRGVRIRTSQGKQYLIGSDHPERLAAVLHAATTPIPER